MEYQFAGFWRRFCAIIIDSLVLAPGTITFILIFGMHSTGYYVCSIILLVSYNTFLVSSNWQATIGKKVMSCYIINVDGTKLTKVQALLRYLLQLVSMITLDLGYLWVAFDSKKRSFHDMLAGTYVVKIPA